MLNSARAFARQHPLGIHILYPHQEHPPPGWYFPAPLGIGHGCLVNSQEISQFNLRSLTSNELDALHLRVEHFHCKYLLYGFEYDYL